MIASRAASLTERHRLLNVNIADGTNYLSMNAGMVQRLRCELDTERVNTGRCDDRDHYVNVRKQYLAEQFFSSAYTRRRSGVRFSLGPSSGPSAHSGLLYWRSKLQNLFSTVVTDLSTKRNLKL